MDVKREHLVVGAFQAFGYHHENQAEEVGKRLEAMRARGELDVPPDVDVTFLPLQTRADSVERFVHSARDLHADKVLLLGENGLGLRVEACALDRGKPRPLLLSAAESFVPEWHRPAALPSAAPVEAMAKAGGAKVSHDPGKFYCNYSYLCALRAGLNAVFVHVPGGIFGLGRDADGSARRVNQMLGAWYQSGTPGPLVMTGPEA